MNWLVLILAFCIAVAMGALLATMLERHRPGWSARRRWWTAALTLPAFIAFATLSAIGCTMAMGPEHGEGDRNLVSAVYAMVGGIFLVIAAIGGVVGAMVSGRKPLG